MPKEYQRKTHEWIAFWMSFFFFPSLVFALSPMDYYNSLVCGAEEAGFQDGAFYQARFNGPCGLAFDDKGERLFVADRDNHRIRVIFLNEDNRVETLTGTGKAGSVDGSLDQASFDLPWALAWVPGGHLVVYDAGNKRFREIDLSAGSVSTLACDSSDCKTTAAPAFQVWNIVYCSKDNSLYFTEPLGQELQKMDLGSQLVSTVFSKNSQIPQPKALCLDGDHLYVADKDLPTVYEVDMPTATGTTLAPVSLTEVGKGQLIQEMTFSDGQLYALQFGNPPLVRLNPYEPVSLATSWGFTLDESDSQYKALLSFTLLDPVGFASCPAFPRKLFISHPRITDHSLLSVKDYEFDKYWAGRDLVSDEREGVLTDFHYPEAKPPNTFRILVVGDSQILSGDLMGPSDGAVTGEGASLFQFGASPRDLTWPKQLEFMLNAQAALAHGNIHYEVLVLGHPGKSAQLFGYYEAPPLVEKYDIDSVLFFATPYNIDNQDSYSSYFLKKMTQEGVPAQEVDPEYLLTSASKRVPPGIPADLYQRAYEAGFIKKVSPTQDYFAPFADLLESDDSQIHEDLVQMVGLPLKLLSNKVQLHKTRGGKETSFLLCYAPSGDNSIKTKSDYHVFWRDVISQTQLPFLDLDDSFRVFKSAFYPTNDACCHSHFTAYGDMLVAYLLNYYLVAGKFIPFGTNQGLEGSSK